ncbi:CBS domain-containing protein [Leptolyngbya sp. FACHB-261]|uniref:CBS domain-containing protein n=1 Tax=Leptolyngbya sp. FACHB-261 TaxID=2692806 RepID=UPI001685582E|nr:CBS domain-containing protein [Leptolyngbya sp. FACHB-261]MBD2100506.1 CBS domain-containing protein [Leptolyngbya sp. FACHB-261]
MTKTVADIMTRDLVVVRPETPLKEAIQILAERRISGFPVVAEDGKLVGVLSETDLMRQEAGAVPPAYILFLDSVIYLESPNRYERDLQKALGQTVGEVMTRKPITITAAASLREAARVMADRKINRLPVVDSADRVIGIVTRGDIVRAMAAE